MVQPLWKTDEFPKKKLNIAMTQQFHTYVPETKECICPQKGLYENVQRLYHKVNELKS